MSPLTGAVDYWCNAFLTDREVRWERAIERQGLSLSMHREGDEFCDPATMVARLDEAGFATVVLVVSEPVPEGVDDPNLFEHVAMREHEIAELARTHPGRFAGIWSVEPDAGEAGVQAAERMLRQPWCVGLLNHTHSWNRRFDDPAFDPYYELCARHDVPFVMQAGRSGGDFPHECGQPDGIDRPAAAFPSVRFVLSHTGWPWTTEAIERAARFDNVHLGTATWPLRRWSPELRAFVAGPGRDKVLCGSGFPMTGHRQAARQFARPELVDDLGDDTIRRITSTNARRVFTRLAAPVQET